METEHTKRFLKSKTKDYTLSYPYCRGGIRVAKEGRSPSTSITNLPNFFVRVRRSYGMLHATTRLKFLCPTAEQYAPEKK